MIWSVPRAWPGATCAILAGGPSLRDFDASVLRGRVRVITINDSWRLAPWADILYWCDRSWFDNQIKLDRAAVDGTKFSTLRHCDRWVKGGEDSRFGNQPRHATDPQVRTLKFTGQLGLETNPEGLRHGSNSTYAAMNLAFHFGVKKIILLGVDMHVDGPKTHWHDEHRAPAGNFAQTCQRSFLPCFRFLVEPLRAAGVEVINCTPNSALTLWPHAPLEQALATVPAATAA